MNMNVFSFSFKKSYYLTHPFAFLKELKLNLISARDRITKGYCAMDIYEMYSWLLEILPRMLRDLSTNISYPGREPFETKEEWENWLNALADKLESCSDENREKENEYYEAWSNIPAPWNLTPEEQEITKNFHECNEELYWLAKEKVKEVFASLSEHFFDLWS